MRSLASLALALLFAAADWAAAHAAVGFQHFNIPDPKDGRPIEVGVWYPTDAIPIRQRLELGEQTVADNAPVRGDHLPMVVISHGHGGSYAGHVDTAAALANAGFVVAALTHTGDNWRDESLATQIWERPRQLKVLTDYMVGVWPQHASLDVDRIGAFGFSAGGFTVLVEAGGAPDLTRIAPHCMDHPGFETCQIVAAQPLDPAAPVTWTHDVRIKAVVSAAPAIGFAFGRDGLAPVRQPLQLWRAADDRVLPDPYYAEAVREDLPTPPETHVVAKAGHYDFLPPCSAQLAKSAPTICASAPDFDRAAFHLEFDRQVVAFFTRTLGGNRRSTRRSSGGASFTPAGKPATLVGGWLQKRNR
jgi:predicted dienelactone hydrolase